MLAFPCITTTIRALVKVMLPPVKKKLPHNIILKVYKYSEYRLFHVTHLWLLIYFYLIFVSQGVRGRMVMVVTWMMNDKYAKYTILNAETVRMNRLGLYSRFYCNGDIKRRNVQTEWNPWLRSRIQCTNIPLCWWVCVY